MGLNTLSLRLTTMDTDLSMKNWRILLAIFLACLIASKSSKARLCWLRVNQAKKMVSLGLVLSVAKPALLVIMIMTSTFLVFAGNTASPIPVNNSAFAEEPRSSATAHLNAGVDVYTDSHFTNRGYSFVRGDTAYFSAWSNAYTDNGSGLIATPYTNFTIDIMSPENATIFHQRFTADENGGAYFSLSIAKNFTFGTYDVRYTVEKEGFKTITPYSPEPDVSYYATRFVVAWGPDDIVNVGDRYKFELLLGPGSGKNISNGTIEFGSGITLKAKLCPSPFSLLPDHGTYGPTGRPALEGQGPEIIINAKFVPLDEDNNSRAVAQNVTSFLPVTDPCANPFDIPSEVLAASGKWSAIATAQWLQKNDTQHVLQADSNRLSFEVAPTIYRSSNVERITLDPDKYPGTVPLDWSHDGRSILFSYRHNATDYERQKLGILALDAKSVTEFDPQLASLGNEPSNPSIYDAKFTPSGDKIVVLYGGDLYSYDLHLKRATRLTQSGSIGSINIASDGRLFYNKNGTFVIADSEAKNPQVVFSGGEHVIYSGDLSPDGSKVLYRKTLDSGYQWSNSVLAYYDIRAKKEAVIPNIVDSCGAFPKWAPNGYHLLIHESSCSRGWPGATLRMTDLNGSFQEYIVQASNDYPDNFMFSPDGHTVNLAADFAPFLRPLTCGRFSDM
jgi:hypothetical protein